MRLHNFRQPKKPSPELEVEKPQAETNNLNIQSSDRGKGEDKSEEYSLINPRPLFVERNRGLEKRANSEN